MATEAPSSCSCKVGVKETHAVILDASVISHLGPGKPSIITSDFQIEAAAFGKRHICPPPESLKDTQSGCFGVMKLGRSVKGSRKVHRASGKHGGLADKGNTKLTNNTDG